MSALFEQCLPHTLSDGTSVPCYGTRTQRAELTAVGGRTVYVTMAGGFGQSTYEWRMFVGQFGLIAWEGMNNGGGARCASPASITPAPYYATIGSSGTLATCAPVSIPGDTVMAPVTRRWSVRSADSPGMALVCLDEYCFRTDESGNIDSTMYPWAPQ
jgi:hypothetical protein